MIANEFSATVAVPRLPARYEADLTGPAYRGVRYNASVLGS
jgi:hypothetical protein